MKQNEKSESKNEKKKVTEPSNKCTDKIDLKTLY